LVGPSKMVLAIITLTKPHGFGMNVGIGVTCGRKSAFTP
jgi:hypothetical protein